MHIASLPIGALADRRSERMGFSYHSLDQNVPSSPIESDLRFSTQNVKNKPTDLCNVDVTTRQSSPRAVSCVITEFKC